MEAPHTRITGLPPLVERDNKWLTECFKAEGLGKNPDSPFIIIIIIFLLRAVKV
jgi:hypothetical protein